jgi:CRP/FNR family transcriptional regulator
MRAEERVAAFLLNLSERLTALRMTREEVGIMLGMKLETVARTLSKFQKDALIEIVGEHVPIASIEGLRAVVGR